MKRLASACLGLIALASGCGRQEQQLIVASLEASGAISFLCVGPESQPREMRDCPDDDRLEDDGESRSLVAMVTQTSRGEVAAIDISRGRLIDSEPSQPGQTFLPVGAQPGAIVSTPGGVATFVGVGEPGREGIFALPTTCIGTRPAGQLPRDITSWPACRLPVFPGEMAVVVDPADSDGNLRASCDGEYVPLEASVGAAAFREECPADLSLESNPPGRRKLVVTLPDWGELAVIDAGWLLDREPGTFEPCELERRVPLRVNLPEVPVPQRPPSDLDVSLCATPALAPSIDVRPRPAGMQVSDDRSRIFIGDRNAPVIHVFDTNVCELSEAPPLLPTSLLEPGRLVTTSKLAVSPLTSEGRRYLYAIDDEGGGSVMVFDVSEDSQDRTPLIRERSAEFPFEPPDRIAFSAPAKDVAFAFNDFALPDLALGSSVDAIACEPDPSVPSNDPGAGRRPSPDLTSGANPRALRGVFGFLALSSGQLAIVDVDDRDAPCRRPIQTNTGEHEDFRGCSGDPWEGPLVSGPTDRPTVSGEVSCQVVQPHRARSSRFVINGRNFGVRAPALRTFPRLTSELGRRLPTDQTTEGRNHPKMLGVDFSESEPAQVYIGPALHENREVTDALVIDPARAEQNSLVLSFAEPRAYALTEQFSAVYEGLVVSERPAAKIERGPTGLSLTDSGIAFCDRGIEGTELMSRRGASLGVSDEALRDFGARHADYVEITSNIPREESTYWASGAGASCGSADPGVPGSGYGECRERFGTRRAPLDLRQFRVERASRSTLELRPRNHQDSSFVRDLVACCFPEPVNYTVRASRQWVVRGDQSGLRHRIRTGASGVCEVDPCPLRAAFSSRAFEVSCDPESCPQADDGSPVIGLAEDDDIACVVAAPDPSTRTLGGPGSECIFSNLTTNFVIYRGREESTRGMAFSWEVQGGFSPMLVDVSAIGGNPTVNTVPVSMSYSPEARLFAIADGATKGVTIVSVATLSGRSFY
jgi:hypothetical protein